jgi:FixJ family two-component response regulator
MSHQSVLVLDDDDDLRAILCDLFSSLDADCWAVSSVDEMIALGDRVQSCTLALLDVNLGSDRPSGLDAYEWLKAHSFAGRIVFLTAHARSHPVVHRAYSLGVQVFEKPIPAAELIRLVSET